MKDDNLKKTVNSRREFMSKLLKTGGGLGVAIVAGTSFPLEKNAAASFTRVDGNIYREWDDFPGGFAPTWLGCTCTCMCTCRQLCLCTCGCSQTTQSTQGTSLRTNTFNTSSPPTSSAYNDAITEARKGAYSTPTGTKTYYALYADTKSASLP